jgi:hypothetical protein
VASSKVFDAAEHGAVGDGRALDTAALQAAVDACAAAGGGTVLLRGHRRYRSGTVRLRDRVGLHLAEGAVLEMSLDRADYTSPALITADGAEGVSISGPGRIEGRATDFMAAWDDRDGLGEWIYTPRPWRPTALALRGCREVELREFTLADAPFWGLHLLGCEHVGIEGLTVRNNLAVPNCDGIDLDRSRDVEVRDCSIHSGDDAIVVKATAQPRDHGPASGIRVHDCELVTQDSALKIGTETCAEIRDVRFERCTIPSCNRACTIQLRDGGDVHDVLFSDITFHARYFSTPWWGHGEAVSVTALPRAPDTRLGTVSGVRFRRLSGRSENSVRLDGSPGSRLHDLTLEEVDLTLERWTGFPGGVFDNRPTAQRPELLPHGTPGIHVAHADGVTLRNTRIGWGRNRPPYFSYALETEDVTGLRLDEFQGESADPGRWPAILSTGKPAVNDPPPF